MLDPDTGQPYTPNPADWVAALSNVPLLLNRSGLTLQQLYQLLEVAWVTQSDVTLQAGTTTVAGVKVLSPDIDDMTFTGLTGDVLDRANRFLRLWNASGLQMWELDWALGPGALDNPFLVLLADALTVRDRLALPFQEVLSFWMPLETRDVTDHLGDEDTVVPATYTEVFRNPAVLATAGQVFVSLNVNVVTGATDEEIIVITTASPHGYQNGQQVSVKGVLGNTAANGTFDIAVLSATKFYLLGASGNGAWTGGGTVTGLLSGNPITGVSVVTGASDAAPIEITTAEPHGYQEGQQVSIAGVLGNTAANGTFTIAVTGPATFTLNGSAGNGTWTSGGTVTGLFPTAEQNAITASLGLSAGDIAAILAFTSAADTLSPDTLNVLLRYQRLASALGLDVAGLIDWIQLTGGQPFGGAPADTLEFLRRLSVLQGTGLGVYDLDYLLRDQSASQTSLAFTQAQATAALQAIRDAIAKLPRPATPGPVTNASIQAIFAAALAAATGSTADVVTPLLRQAGILPLDQATIDLLLAQTSGVNPAGFPALISGFTTVAKGAALFTALRPTAAEFAFAVLAASSYGWLDPGALPVVPVSESPYAAFEALLTAFRLNRRQPARAPKLFDILGQWLPPGTVPPDAPTAVAALAPALDASDADVLAIADALGAGPPALDAQGRPGSLADMTMLAAIAAALDVASRYRLSGAMLVQLAGGAGRRDGRPRCLAGAVRAGRMARRHPSGGRHAAGSPPGRARRLPARPGCPGHRSSANVHDRRHLQLLPDRPRDVVLCADHAPARGLARHPAVRAAMPAQPGHRRRHGGHLARALGRMVVAAAVPAVAGGP